MSNHEQHWHHNNHENHSQHGHHDHEGMVQDFKRRFYISLIVTIPILFLSPMIQGFLGVDWRFPYDQYILFVLSTF